MSEGLPKMPLFFSGVLLTFMVESPAKKDARTPEKSIIILFIGFFLHKLRFFLRHHKSLDISGGIITALSHGTHQISTNKL
jgi:hypothetical protein